MVLEATFADLSAHLQALRDSLKTLRTTAVEDRPLQGDAVLVDVFGDAADDLSGWLEEAIDAAETGRQAVGGPVDLDRARRSLAVCQERFNRLTDRFTSDLVRYERIAELVRLGRERGGEWRAWSRSVKEALDDCRQPIYDATQGLFQCWQELAERAGMTSVSVQTTTIGQQIRIPEGSELIRAGMT
jgi:hypothetical protein